jgi:hypothetical protein
MAEIKKAACVAEIKKEFHVGNLAKNVLPAVCCAGKIMKNF